MAVHTDLHKSKRQGLTIVRSWRFKYFDFFNFGVFKIWLTPFKFVALYSESLYWLTPFELFLVSLENLNFSDFLIFS
jgi:hypothetical protein